MVIGTTSYRYEVVRIYNEGKPTKQYAIHDQNTDTILAYGAKKEVTSAVRLLCLGGTVALASALQSLSKRRK